MSGSDPVYDLGFVNELDLALGPTRVLRLALNVLYDQMDTLYDEATDAAAAGRFHDAMHDVHQRLRRVEGQALARCGLADFFTVVTPLSPLSPPPPQAMSEITTAVRTLERHGMLARQSDALTRDRDPRDYDQDGNGGEAAGRGEP